MKQKLFSMFLATVIAATTVIPGSSGNTAAAADINTAPGKPTDIKVEMLEYAYGINTKNPAFSWVVNDVDKNETQTAYRIVVSSTSSLKGDVLDTGWVESDESSYVHADALEDKLLDNELYYWQVQTKDKNGAESPLSDARPFMTDIAGEWKSLNGIWSVANANKETDTKTWTDFTVEQTLSINGENNKGYALAVLMRMSADGKEGYMVQVRNKDNCIKVHRISGGIINTQAFAEISLAEKGISLPDDSTEFKVKITALGALFSFAIDTGNGYVETESVDLTNEGNLKSGIMGYRTGGNESGTVDDLKVTDTTGKVLYENYFDTDEDSFANCTQENGKLKVGKKVFSVLRVSGEVKLQERSNFSFFRSPRLSVGAKDTIDKAIVSIAGIGTAKDRGIIADIFMNGVCLGAGSARELGKVGSYGGNCNYTQVYYNSYDVTKLLGDGDANVISAVGNCRDSKRGILVQMTVFYKDGTKKVITNSGVNNSGWKTLDGTQAFGDEGKFIKTGYVNILHENINSNEYPAGWYKVEFDDSDWADAKVESKVADYTTGQTGRVLYPYPSENILRVETLASNVYVNDSGNIIVDFGKEIIGGMRINLESASEQKVTVHMGEEMNDNGTVKWKLSAVPEYEDVWTLKSGTNSFDTVTMRNFRYVEFIGLDDATKKAFIETPSSVKGWAIRQEFDNDDSFYKAEDDSEKAVLMNRLYELCKYTIQATNQDVYTDSQARERAPYEGDLLVNSNTSYVMSGNYSLARHSNEWLIDNETWPNDYRLFSVEMAYWDYIYTGNIDSLRENYDALKRKLTAEVEYEDEDTGLIRANESQAGNSALIDWPTSERDGYQEGYYDVVFNSEYVGIYKLMSVLCTALDETEDAAYYEEKSKKLKATLIEYAYDEENGCFYDSLSQSLEATKHSSTHATAYALTYGVFDNQVMADAMCEFVYNKCKDEFKGSVYVTYFILKGLYVGNHGEYAEELMTNPKTGENVKTFASLLDNLKCTITPEAWGHKYKKNMTLSHPWGAAPGCSIVQGTFGILPTKAGFEEFDIRLQPGSITAATVKTPTVKGAVEVSYANAGVENGMEVKVSIPVNTKAKVYIPVTNKKIKYLIVDGKMTEAVSDGNYLMTELGSGTWDIRVGDEEMSDKPGTDIQTPDIQTPNIQIPKDNPDKKINTIGSKAPTVKLKSKSSVRKGKYIIVKLKADVPKGCKVKWSLNKKGKKIFKIVKKTKKMIKLKARMKKGVGKITVKYGNVKVSKKIKVR